MAKSCWNCAHEKIGVPVGQGRELILSIQQGPQADGFTVSVGQLCRWFGVPHQTVCYRPTKTSSKVWPDLAGSIKTLIEQEHSFGYRLAPRSLIAAKAGVRSSLMR